MLSKLKKLVSLVIESVIEVHDYLQLVFSDGTILNIYNNYSYDKDGNDPVSSIEGVTIINVLEDANRVRIRLSNGGQIVVGLKDEDYSGPEAMELIRKGEPPVVWN